MWKIEPVVHRLAFEQARGYVSGQVKSVLKVVRQWRKRMRHHFHDYFCARPCRNGGRGNSIFTGCR